MTSQKIKFYKFNNSTTSASKVATAKAVEGAVIYLVDVRELWIGGSTPKLVIKGANDVTFANNVLTINHYDNAGVATTQTLDFSDVASASSTMAVFEQIYTKMGLTGASHDTIDYSGTNYLSDLGTTGHPDKNLVNADKALDAAIHNNTTMAADSAAVYDTEHLSTTWTTVVNANEIEAGDAVTADVEKLDKKVAQLANEVIANEQVTQEAFTTVANSVGLESDMSLDLSDANLTVIQGDTSVKEALEDLDAAIAAIDAPVDDVRINGTTIVDANDIADIAVEGTYNSGSNKIATQSTVSDAINALDVNTDTGAAAISGSSITIKGVQQENGRIKDGGTTTINLEGTYNETTNKIATQSTISNAIDAMAGAGLEVNAAGVITATTQDTTDDTTNVATTAFVHNVVGTLDTSSDVHDVVYTAADASNGAKLTFKGVSETDGKIAQGSGTTQLQFAKVATTGAAADVSIADTGSHTQETTVEGALQEIYGKVEALEGSFDVIISTNAETTPYGVKWMDGQTEITGTLPASAKTWHKIYLVPSGSGEDSYKEYITRRTGTSPNYTYNWEKLGNTSIDLIGYVKTITVNGKTYPVDTNSTNITLVDMITSITGETAISGGNTNFVKVAAETSKDTTTGTNVTTLATTAKVQAVSTADANNQGLAEASDVKSYVDGEIGKLDVTEYQQASVVVDNTNHASTLKIKGIQETDGKIAAATTTTDVAIDGEYNETNNKIATKSTVTKAIEGLDKSASTVTGTNVSVNYSEADGIVTVNSVSESYATITRTAKASGVTPNLVVTSGDDSKLVKASDIANTKLYTDDKIADEIEKLDANVTSNNAAVATVQVVETDGKVTGVNVTNVSAGVKYTQSVSGSSQPDLTATTSTGAVTGADIATIKSYIDDKSEMCWEEYEL
jgi:hypothetical protein